MARPDHREDVDGLRAVAVLAVFLFHLDIAALSGGFAGVDVFYVISGYVIFRGMIREQAEGRFRAAEFYRRRLRRIYPALALVVVLSLAAGWVLLTPAEYVALAESALAAILSISNFYFNDRLGYFAGAGDTFPLLHTWSLGVEEQFYLVAPVVLILLTRHWGADGLWRGLGVMGAASFAYNLFAVYGLGDENHAFYLPMSRFWEIAAGGLVACAEARGLRVRGRVAEALAALALAGLIAALVLIDETVAFPGLAALAPVGATALAIFAAPQPGGAVHRLLANGPMQFFGRISYSLYLFHWPVVVFFGLTIGRDANAVEKLALLGLATVLATASWHLVEEPLRRGRTGGEWRRARAGIAGAAVLILAGSAGVIAADGAPWRLTAEARAAAVTAAALEAIPRLGPCAPLAAARPVPAARICMPADGGAESVDVLLWGDSHAAMIASPLGETLKGESVGLALATMADCPPLLQTFTSKRKNRAACGELGKEVLRLIGETGVPTVVLAARWANLASAERAPGDGSLPKRLYDSVGGRAIDFATALSRTVDALSAKGARVVVLGPVPEIEVDLPQMMVRAANLGQQLPAMPRGVYQARQAEVLWALEGLEDAGVPVVHPHDVLCDTEVCALFAEGAALYVDDDHLSPAGTARVLPPLLAALREGRDRAVSGPNGARSRLP